MNLEERCLAASYQPLPINNKNTHQYYRSTNYWLTFLSHKLPKNTQPNGWKFHISIEHAYLNEVWPIIEPILLAPEAAILGFKVYDITYDLLKLKGKQIILYTFDHPLDATIQSPEAIFELLIKLESVLRYHKIPAGIHPEVSKKIPGSRYISMRHDLNLTNGKYLLKEEALALSETHSYNPFGYKNPYEHFSFCNPSGNKQSFFSQKNVLTSQVEWVGQPEHEKPNANDLQHFSRRLQQLCFRTADEDFTQTHFGIQFALLLFQYPDTTEIILSPRVIGIYLSPEYLFTLVCTLQNYPNIDRLNLSDYEDQPIGKKVIDAIHQNTYLKYVDLSKNYDDRLDTSKPRQKKSPSSVIDTPSRLLMQNDTLDTKAEEAPVVTSNTAAP